MAINTVSTRYHGLIFDGENSRDYGVYITEPAVFNAPERDVEFISIPGRSGDYELDRGRWHNITVTYSCAFFTDTVSDFNEGLSDFRNMLASKTGYCRLEDEINTGEYRMGSFVSGMEIDTFNPKTGTFDVVFNCKPQRWLTTGETAVAVASGDTITNPTLYDASPILLVNGYGTIGIGEQTISISDMIMGNIYLGTTPAKTFTFDGSTKSTQTTFQPNLVNSQNPIFFDNCSISLSFTMPEGTTVTEFLATSEPYTVFSNSQALINQTGKNTYEIIADLGYTEVAFPGDTGQGQFDYSFKYKLPGTTTEISATTRLYARYTVDNNGLVTVSGVGTITPDAVEKTLYISSADIWAESTVSVLGDPMYIDLELGEGYNMDSGTPVSTNRAITMPEDLITLPPGDSEITISGNITALKIAPRWWQL